MLNDYVNFASLLGNHFAPLGQGQMDMISVGIMGLVCLLVLVFAIMATKTWHWVNVVFLVLTMISGVLAAMAMSKIREQRVSDLTDYAKAEKRLQLAEESLEKITIGDPLATSYEPGTLRYADEQLSKALVGQGRVWSGGTVTADGANRKFTFAAERNVESEGELQDFILHVFQDRQVQNQDYPARYVGSVRVVAESGQDLTLEAVDIVDQQLFAQPEGTWTLFEKTPQDQHGIFKRAILTLVENAESDPTNAAQVPEAYKQFAASVKEAEQNRDLTYDISLFRQILMNNYLPAQAMGYDPNSAEYENLIDRFSFDGLPLGKIQAWIDENSGSRISPRFEPDPEETFYVLRFNSKSKQSYPVDSTGSLENDGHFTLNGGAVVPQLQNKADVEFEAGDEVWVDSLSAEGYARGQDSSFKGILATEDVEKINDIYVRELKDYPYEFSELNRQAASLIREIKRVEIASAIQDKAYADAQKQIAARNTLINDLQADQEKLQADVNEITSVANEKEATSLANAEQIESLKQNIDQLYQQIRKSALEMARRAFTKP